VLLGYAWTYSWEIGKNAGDAMVEHFGAGLVEPRLRDRLNSVVSNASTLWQRGLVHHPDFTLHGMVHAEKVAELVEMLAKEIPSSLSLNGREGFVLVSSVYLHDIGMLFPLDSFMEETVQSNPTLRRQGKFNCCKAVITDFCQKCGYGGYAERFFDGLEERPLPSNMMKGEVVRHFHHLFSEFLIRRHGEILGLPRQAVPLVASVSKGHRVVDLTDEEYSSTIWSGHTVRKGPLAALLRVADELDYSSERAPDILFHVFAEDLVRDPESLKHWIRHFCIRSVGPVQFGVTPEIRVEPVVNMAADIPREDYRAIIDEQMEKSLSQVSRDDVKERLHSVGICCPRVKLEINVDSDASRLPMPLSQRIGDLKVGEFLRLQKENVVIAEEEGLVRDGFADETIARMVGYKRKLYSVKYDCVDKKQSKISWEVHVQATQELSHVRHFFEQTDEPFELVSELYFDNLTPERRLTAVRRLTRGNTYREIDVTIDPPLGQGEKARYTFNEVYRNLFAHSKRAIDKKVQAGLWPFDDAVEAVGSQVLVPTDELRISVVLPEGVAGEQPDFRTKLVGTTIGHEGEDKRLRELECLTIDDFHQCKHLSLVVPGPQLMVTYWLVWVPKTGRKRVK